MTLSTSDFLLQTSREYSIYVCETRAIPRVTDGLKSGQRMALWVLRNRAEKIKTFALTGALMAEKLYVHGDSSANATISLLAAPYKNNLCLIEGLGQFGSRVAPDKDGIGAPRYTEVRRAKAAEMLLYRDLDLVPLEDNYDGSNQQPVTFLPLVPLVLLNGVSGVAVAWSTDILPRSLKSLVEATKAALRGKPIPPLPPHYARYDITVRATGKPNQWQFSGKATIVDTSTIQISELPPGMAIEAFRKRLNEMEDADTIQSYVDRSTEVIDITVKMKRGSLKDWTEERALDLFKLREITTERIVVVDWQGKAIRTYETPETLVQDFAAWRLGWYTKRFEQLRADALYERRYWAALDQLFTAGFPARLGAFVDRASMEADIRALLGEATDLDDSQFERITGLPTYRWTQAFAAEVAARIAELDAAVAQHEATLASPERLVQVYLDELDALKALSKA